MTNAFRSSNQLDEALEEAFIWAICTAIKNCSLQILHQNICNGKLCVGVTCWGLEQSFYVRHLAQPHAGWTEITFMALIYSHQQSNKIVIRVQFRLGCIHYSAFMYSVWKTLAVSIGLFSFCFWSFSCNGVCFLWLNF